MDLILSTEQGAMLDRLAKALDGAPTDRFDAATLKALRDGGFVDLARDGSAGGLLAASLAVEKAAYAGILAPLGVQALVLPLFGDADGIAAIAPDGPGPALARYAAQADILIRCEGEKAVAYRIDPAKAQPAETNFVYPLAILPEPGQAVIGTASADDFRKRMRIALAAELVGTVDAGLSALATFLSQRHQFGRLLGGFQAIHHRLAEMAIDLEAGRWLSRAAAWADDAGDAATAAAYMARIGRRHCFEVHQLAGARGFTLDLGLSHHTLRMRLLSMELGGPIAHEADAQDAYWPIAA